MNNSTHYLLLLYLREELIHATITSLVGLFGFIFNIVVCIVIFTNKSLQKQPLNHFIASLALSDLLMACAIGPAYMFRFIAIIDHERFKDFPISASTAICQIKIFVIGLSLSITGLTLAMISVERRRAILYPFSLPMSKRKVFIILAAIWLISGVTGYLLASVHGFLPQFPFVCQLTSKSFQFNAIVAVIFSFFSNLFPLPIMIVCYANIIMELGRKSLLRNQVYQQYSTLKIIKKKYKSIVALLLITLLTATSSSPFIITYVFISYRQLMDYRYTYKVHSSTFWKYFQAASIAMLVPCSLNPILYNFASSTFQQEIKAIPKKLRCNCYSNLRTRKNSSGKYILPTLI
ncbi:Pyroglutamylated RFamide peptide receptor [Trichoplax sp. H2]|nr:Pyroglutamylated RFamide peptide receptor [Trichoplax sp. H2]|eukprot:RDD36764.1 Pyroglutamylated RFamide peptide receptor [Trichoplax sp. H2]